MQPGFKSKHWKEFSKYLFPQTTNTGTLASAHLREKAGGARADAVTGAGAGVGAGWWLLVFGLVLLDIKTTLS